MTPPGPYCGSPFLLFIFCINDICEVYKLLRFVWFADGTIIFCGEDNLKSSDEKIQSEMVKLKSWFHVDKLSFNLLKTRFMVIAKKKVKMKFY